MNAANIIINVSFDLNNDSITKDEPVTKWQTLSFMIIGNLNFVKTIHLRGNLSSNKRSITYNLHF